MDIGLLVKKATAKQSKIAFLMMLISCQHQRSENKSNFNVFARGRHALLPQESLRHILASHGTIVNRGKCYMDRKRILCLSNASQHVPIYLQPFPSNSTRKFKRLPFLHFFCTFWPLLGISPGTIAANVTRLERGFNACKMPHCIYLSIFNHFWYIAIYRWWVLVKNCDIFILHLCLPAPQGVHPVEISKILIHTKLEWMGYRVVKKAWQYV